MTSKEMCDLSDHSFQTWARILSLPVNSWLINLQLLHGNETSVAVCNLDSGYTDKYYIITRCILIGQENFK